jgi:hypothetical protein
MQFCEGMVEGKFMRIKRRRTGGEEEDWTRYLWCTGLARQLSSILRPM